MAGRSRLSWERLLWLNGLLRLNGVSLHVDVLILGGFHFSTSLEAGGSSGNTEPLELALSALHEIFTSVFMVCC